MPKRFADQPIRVLVVDDTASQRVFLTGLVNSSGMLVVGTAGNGQEALAATQKLRPDVIALDIHMPVMDGFEASRQIMQHCPTPIVLMSSAADSSERTVEAISASALAVVRKPGAIQGPHHDQERTHFLTTLRLMADVLVVTRRPIREYAPTKAQALQVGQKEPLQQLATLPVASVQPQILAVAASTGGPAAVQALLNGIGHNFPLPILLAQHIAIGFMGPYADWLHSTTGMQFILGQSNERLLPGKIYLAPDSQHISLFIRDYIAYRPADSEDVYCPSANILFESVAKAYGKRAIGVVLTGMGEDGARGLLSLRKAGGYTFAQDEASSVVYGMPRAAFESGAAMRTGTPAELAFMIRKLCTS